MLPRGHSRFDEAFSEQFAEDPPPIHGSPIYMPGPNLQFPAGRLLKASDGFFYGTIVAGGPGQGGAVFRFADAPDRQFSIILNFSDSDQAGVYLKAGLVEGPDGLLYGTTSSDYVNPAEGVERFSGAVFRLNKDGSGLTVLKRFPTSGIDGANPQANLFFGSNGVIYGTTPAGGETGHGTIFVLYP